MKFFHVYNDHCVQGLEKNNLLNADSGFKIQNVFSVPFDRKFNSIAAKGSPLYNRIREGNIPLYVDRIAGGITYQKYAYDQDLLRTYQEMLGDWFLGVQLHESASNRRTDWKRILKTMDGSHGPYDAEVLDKLTKRSYAKDTDGTPLNTFSQDTPQRYAKMTYADRLPDYIEEVEEMFSYRMGEVNGLILPCDSYILATRMQDKLGMKTFMPEIGSQIPMTRIAVALVRGTAKATGKTWGGYYECWRADLDEKDEITYSMPCFNTELLNEWYLTQETHHDDFTTHGENGGSSRLLQNRLYYYMLMCGADYFSEEWGLNCSYTDMHEFTLSKYGQCKKDFIHTAAKMRGIKANVPFAIVLPKTHEFVFLPEPFVDYSKLETMSAFYNLRAANPKAYAHTEAVLDHIFGRVNPLGNEGHVITNSRYGDLFDIIYEDADASTLAQYTCLIDASADGTFAKANANKNLNILETSELEKLEHTLKQIIRETMPCSADGLCWLVSTDENGQRYLSVFNNEGNTRTSAHGDVIDHAADETITVTFKDAASPEILPCSADGVNLERISDTEYRLSVPATALAILKF